MSVVEELDAAIARARGERVGVTDGSWYPQGPFVVADDLTQVAAAESTADARHIAAWADPVVTDATVAVWQALRDMLATWPNHWTEQDDLTPTERAVLAQVRAYLGGAS